MNPKAELEKRRLVCGPMSVSVDGVCRRKLEEKFNTLLDRLTHEVHPEYVKPEAPKGYEFDAKGNLVNTAEKLQKERQKDLKKVIEGINQSGDGKSKQPGFQEGLLMGNSKLLADPTGKLPEHKEKSAKKPGKTSQGTKPKTK
jgi:hypothetical protein